MSFLSVKNALCFTLCNALQLCLLTSEKTKSTAATYDNTGSKTQAAASTTIDQSI